ncbi:MAG: adenosylcobinamide-phosphate synthase CbiB [Rhodospirillales bacterium]|nr:adenosylcobinamide-phosphate synthase CbiB [Rhodospirillales bacterium]MDP6884915.1 adenosylcobinamide-phosphate synthase CbiB [Rhodospirillales bacterium]
MPAYPDGASLLVVLIIALMIDIVAGDPAWLYRAVPHPVALLGRAVSFLEVRWNDGQASSARRRRLGALSVLLIAAGAAGLAWTLVYGLRQFSWGWGVEALAASTLLAFRGLHDHVRGVASALDEGTEAGRRAVAEIVGRDPASLDGPGVARAAIESAAENFADGVIAPAFWFLVAGLPGMAAYKAINTLDSMIGYPSPRHADFGRAAARLDDAANLVPARIAGVLIALAATVIPGASGTEAWRAMVRDAPRHRSPNAGWPEAAMAGALGLALAGPRQYTDETVDDAWMGSGRLDADSPDIRRALVVYLGAGAIGAGLTGVGLLI